MNYDSFLKDVKEYTSREIHRKALEKVDFKQLPKLKTNNIQFIRNSDEKPRGNLKMKHLMSDQAFLKFKRRKLFNRDYPHK